MGNGVGEVSHSLVAIWAMGSERCPIAWWPYRQWGQRGVP